LVASRLVFDLNPNSSAIMPPPGPCTSGGWAPGVAYDDVFVPASMATAFVNLTRASASSGPLAAMQLTFVHWPEAIDSLVRMSVNLAENVHMLPKIFPLSSPAPMARSAVMRAEWQTDSNLFDVNDAIRTRLLSDSSVLWSRRIVTSATVIVPAFAEVQVPIFDTGVLRSTVERFDLSLTAQRQPVTTNITLDGFTLPLVTFSRISDIPPEYTELQVTQSSNQSLVLTPTFPSNVSIEVVRFFAPNPFVLLVTPPRLNPSQMMLDHCVPRTVANNVILSTHNVFFTKLSATVGDAFISNASLFDYLFSVHLMSANNTHICMRLLRSFSGGSLDASFLLVHTSDFTDSTLPPTPAPPATTPAPPSTSTVATTVATTVTDGNATTGDTTTLFELATTAPVVINGTTAPPPTEGLEDTSTTTGIGNNSSTTSSNTMSSTSTNVSINATTTTSGGGTTTSSTVRPSNGTDTSGGMSATGVGSSGANATAGSADSESTSTATAASADGDLQKDESDLSPTTIGIIAGAGGGGLCLGLLVAVGAVCLCRRKSRDGEGGGARQPKADDPEDPQQLTQTAGVTTASASGEVEMQSARFEPLASSAERPSSRVSIYGASPLLTLGSSEGNAGPYAAFPTEESQQLYSPPPVGGAAGVGAPSDEHHTYAPAPMARDDHHTYAPAPKKPNTYSAPPVTTNEPMGQYGQFDTLEDGAYQQLEIN
jgi:hypothetical protein